MVYYDRAVLCRYFCAGGANESFPGDAGVPGGVYSRHEARQTGKVQLDPLLGQAIIRNSTQKLVSTPLRCCRVATDLPPRLGNVVQATPC